MVGLKEGKTKVDKGGRVKKISTPRNDLFQIMKKMGVQVKASVNMEEALVLADSKSTNKTRKHQNGGPGIKLAERKYWQNTNCRGVLVVYSRDLDFIPLLQRAKKNGFLTVSMSDREKQTPTLVGIS